MSDCCKSDKVIHGINCAVTDCKYNCDKNCTAGEIHVGPKSAETSSETDCQTFKHK